jgi:transposase
MNMNRNDGRYDREFKNDAVGLVRAGRTITEVARDLGVSKWSLGHRVRAEEGQMLSERKSAKSAAMKKALLRKVREHFTFVRINADDFHDVPAPIGGVGNPGFLERPMRARGGSSWLVGVPFSTRL